MSFDKDYFEILKYAKTLKNKHNSDVEVEELVSETYVRLFGNEDYVYSFDSFKKELYAFLFQDKREAKPLELGTKWGKQAEFKQDVCCDRCKEVKPASMFGINKIKGQHPYLKNICLKCECEKIKLFYKTPKGKATRLRNFKKYVDNNRAEWNRYNRERDKVAKENLTDVYIRKLLRAKYTTQYILDHPQLVIDYRNKLLKKRESAKIKKSVNF